MSGSVSAGRVRLRGDSVTLQKVQGLDVKLVADGGDVRADAVYARRFRASPGEAKPPRRSDMLRHSAGSGLDQTRQLHRSGLGLMQAI